jgi:oligopeptidase B
VFDENVEAAGHDFTAVGDIEVSSNHELVAVSIDHDGDERHSLSIFRLSDHDAHNGQQRCPIEPPICDVSYGVVWSADSSSLFYVTQDHALRPYRLWRYVSISLSLSLSLTLSRSLSHRCDLLMGFVP